MRKDSIQTRKRKSKKRRDLESANSSFVQEALASGVVDPTKILSAGFDFSTCSLPSSLTSRSSSYLNGENNPLIDQLNPFTANALGKMTYKFDDSVMKSFNPFDMLLSTSASNGAGKLPNPYTASYATDPSWLSTSTSDYDLRKATTLTKPPNFPPDLIDSPLNF
ncbi:hypothetical protein Ciccas_009534 [Cichlidogyrus casuarinus]|uniref:Uncharacterized protein n=1 Tax=Cichlidogyrus casuarinus TaxID=1844966 RepID=A0ABD2PWR9_9PLAT